MTNFELFGYNMIALDVKGNGVSLLKAGTIETPLGQMLAVADDVFLYLLAFTEKRGLSQSLNVLKRETHASIKEGRSQPIDSVEEELHRYFKGNRDPFQTPIKMFGTPFQKQVWEQLRKIPFGTVCSYSEIAERIGMPAVVRAVGGANAVNPCAIVVPCHRVVNAGGGLGGYNGGVDRKKWLLRHEGCDDVA